MYKLKKEVATVNVVGFGWVRNHGGGCDGVYSPTGAFARRDDLTECVYKSFGGSKWSIPWLNKPGDKGTLKTKLGHEVSLNGTPQYVIIQGRAARVQRKFSKFFEEE